MKEQPLHYLFQSRTMLARFGLLFINTLSFLLMTSCSRKNSIDWGEYNVLKEKPGRAEAPIHNGQRLSEEEYLQWVYWGEQWFRGETFGNERLWTDVVGLLNGFVDVPTGGDVWKQESTFGIFLQAMDDLDGVQGNLFAGNGGGYTSDLVLNFPPGTLVNKTFPVPEKLHTGLDVEAGEPWPLGIVARTVADNEGELPYLLDPNSFAQGPKGVGPLPGGGKFRIGLSCALCHYSLDMDWDGKPDLTSAKPTELSKISSYQPAHGWAIGNQDIHLGWIFALSSNNVAGFENSGAVGEETQGGARRWAKWVLANHRTNPEDTSREVVRGLLMFPRGFADDTPDGLHNPLQFPSLFTHMNWPFNYDGVMLNPSDRNNNVWTTGLDLSQLVALCKDRGGRTAKLAFWEEPGLYSELTAEQYADIVVSGSPAVKHDPTQRGELIADILGTSDGIPGLLSNGSVVLIKGVPGAIPEALFEHPDNKANRRIRSPEEFGVDGKARGPMVGLLGTRVVTPPSTRSAYRLDELAKNYGLNVDEFVTESVSLMLDWVEPPPNLSPLVEGARRTGLIEKGYEVFKSAGCAGCHAGPFTTDNLIYPMKEIKTNTARGQATELLQVIAPQYDPQTGKAETGGILGIIANIFAGKEQGYKTLTLRYVWGSAPYLHDGGVGIALQSPDLRADTSLQQLLQCAEADKIYGIGQILVMREASSQIHLRPNAPLSLQAVVLKSEREKVIAENKKQVWPIPGTDDHVSIASLQIEGVGHEYWIDDEPGGETVTALVAFLLALDDNPGE